MSAVPPPPGPPAPQHPATSLPAPQPSGQAAQRRPRRWLAPALGGAGLGVGLLAGWALFGSGDDEEPPAPAGAAADSEAACLLLAGLPGVIDFQDDAWDIEGPLMWRLRGATTAFQAAASADPAYTAVGEDARTLERAILMFDGEQITPRYDDLRDWCAERADGSSDGAGGTEGADG